MYKHWKITAIIFMILFFLLLSFNIWAVNYSISEDKSINDCYYNTCSDYPDADYQDGLCTCYDINDDGEYTIGKTLYK